MKYSRSSLEFFGRIFGPSFARPFEATFYGLRSLWDTARGAPEDMRMKARVDPANRCYQFFFEGENLVKVYREYSHYTHQLFVVDMWRPVSGIMRADGIPESLAVPYLLSEFQPDLRTHRVVDTVESDRGLTMIVERLSDKAISIFFLDTEIDRITHYRSDEAEYRVDYQDMHYMPHDTQGAPAPRPKSGR